MSLAFDPPATRGQDPEDPFSLLKADLKPDTVTKIAFTYGFSNPGRMAHSYRALFEELPSETLRR